jgi:hypothetical protein
MKAQIQVNEKIIQLHHIEVMAKLKQILFYIQIVIVFSPTEQNSLVMYFLLESRNFQEVINNQNFSVTYLFMLLSL